MSAHWMDDYPPYVERIDPHPEDWSKHVADLVANNEMIGKSMRITHAEAERMGLCRNHRVTATEIAIAEQSRLFREARRKIIHRKFLVIDRDLNQPRSGYSPPEDGVGYEEGSVEMRGNGELLTFMGIRVTEAGAELPIFYPGTCTLNGHHADNEELMELPIPDLILEQMCDGPWPTHKALSWIVLLIRRAQRLGLSVAAVRSHQNREVLFVFLGVEAQSKVLGLLNHLRTVEGLAEIDTRDNSRGA